MKRFYTLAMLILSLLLISSCTGVKPVDKNENEKTYREFEQGSWQESAYTNSWLGITFTLPNNLSPLTADELKENVTAFEYIYNEPGKEKIDLTTDTTGVFYEIALKDTNKICCVLLCIEDTQKTVGNDFVSIDAYVNTTKEKVEQSAILPYDLSENTISEIAGNDYISFSADNSYIRNTYYIMKYENMFVTWVITDYTGQKSDLNAFVKNIMVFNTDNTSEETSEE